MIEATWIAPTVCCLYLFVLRSQCLFAIQKASWRNCSEHSMGYGSILSGERVVVWIKFYDLLYINVSSWCGWLLSRLMDVILEKDWMSRRFCNVLIHHSTDKHRKKHEHRHSCDNFYLKSSFNLWVGFAFWQTGFPFLPDNYLEISTNASTWVCSLTHQTPVSLELQHGRAVVSSLKFRLMLKCPCYIGSTSTVCWHVDVYYRLFYIHVGLLTVNVVYLVRSRGLKWCFGMLGYFDPYCTCLCSVSICFN